MELFESGWTFDHFYPIFSDSTGPCLEGWITTTALAQATSRLRFGLLVSANVYRHPAVLANMAATLDVLSEGRLELGLGAGWNVEECDAYGIHLPPWAARFDMLDEACEVLHLLLGPSAEVSFDGKHYRLINARCEPKPVQSPRPPLCVGGSGERRTLRTVAKYADHWNYPGGSPEEFEHKRKVLVSWCESLGRDAGTIVTSTHLRGVEADGSVDGLRAEVEAYAAVGLDLGIVVLPAPHDAAVLSRVADVIEPFAASGNEPS